MSHRSSIERLEQAGRVKTSKFLDPDAKIRRPSSSASSDMSGFFSPQKPLASPRDPQRLSLNRKAALERTISPGSKTASGLAEFPRTVRLVQPSSSRPQTPSSYSREETKGGEIYANDDHSERGGAGESGTESEASNAEKQAESEAITRLPRSAVQLVKEEGASDSYPGFVASHRHFDVSDAKLGANEAYRVHLDEIREPSTSSTTLFADSSAHSLPAPSWHRRSTSSGYNSNCSTLQDSEIAATIGWKAARSQRSSQGTTLRGTPTPYEYENQARAKSDDAPAAPALRSGPAEALQTLQEVSPERLTTVRAVPDSETSPSSASTTTRERSPGSRLSEGGSLSKPRTVPIESESPPSSTLRGSRRRRAWSTGSIHTLPSISNLQDPYSSPVIETFGSDAASIAEPPLSSSSSPNFIAYDPSPSSARPFSRGSSLRGEPSFDSIHSRLRQYEPAARPYTGRSLATQSSWASLESHDTLPPLHMPKKRIRHKAASSSLASPAALQAQQSSDQLDDSMESEEIDTLPYPKRPYSSHLSTIASESDGRTQSQLYSHWSLGSGVLTGDDASSFALSPAREQPHHRNSVPVDSLAPSLSSPMDQRTSAEDEGGMPSGYYREESAVPKPLFKSETGPSIVVTGKKYDGPLPPLPPVPIRRESDERVDTLSEMTRPSLHQKRSGYSLRARSNTTPSHSRHHSEISYVDSERFSQGTSIFPTWARHFYSGTAFLSSKVSLHSTSSGGTRPNTRPGTRPGLHRRGESSWTDRSITSHLGQTYSNGESVSPTSSHFLPAIFRPRNRKRGQSANNSRSSRLRKSQKSNKSKTSRPSQDRSSQETQTGSNARPDSMVISPDPLPRDPNAIPVERLPSGQPKWGSLQDPDGPPAGRRPLRKYSKQGQWGEMEFPRPMTKDRLSDFSFRRHPHLAPTKRGSQTRLSMWQAPSFVESLDSLIHSRCNRQILLFCLGFVMPLCWMLGAVLPIPPKPPTEAELEKTIAGSEDDIEAAMMRHEAGDAERRWREEKTYLKAKWWRTLNRIMGVVGLLLIGAVIALVIITTR